MVQRLSLLQYLEGRFVERTSHPGPLVLGYSPMIHRQRTVVATRLTVFPARPDKPVDAVALLAVRATGDQ